MGLLGGTSVGIKGCFELHSGNAQGVGLDGLAGPFQFKGGEGQSPFAIWWVPCGIGLFGGTSNKEALVEPKLWCLCRYFKLSLPLTIHFRL